MNAYRVPPNVLPSLRTGDPPTATYRLLLAEERARLSAAVACPEASPWRFDGPVPRWHALPLPKGPILYHFRGRE